MSRVRITTAGPAEGTVDEAIERGLEFLGESRGSGPLWSDFMTAVGSSLKDWKPGDQSSLGRSVDWTSGFVLYSISGLPEAAAQLTPGREELAKRQRDSGGWGYHGLVPEDCDTTAWALRALTGSYGESRPGAAAKLIEDHRVAASGGFATFTVPALLAIGRHMGIGDERWFRGWSSAHTCVTTNAVLALMDQGVPADDTLVAEALDYLEAQRTPSGLWPSYWWQGPYFATPYALQALHRAGRLPEARLEQSVAALTSLVKPRGGWGEGEDGDAQPFATAHALLALMVGPPALVDRELVGGGVAWLLDRQRDDGSWPTVPILRIPDPRVVDPDREPEPVPALPGTAVVLADDRRVFTTAAVLHTLDRFRKWASGGADRQ